MQYVQVTDRAFRLGERGLTMNSKWIISGMLSTSLALAPALVASAQQASQQTATPGQQGDWGPAGPPPDVQNGQIPPPDSTTQDQDQGPPQYPGEANPDPNQGAGAPAAGAGVGYGQTGRPAYQPGQSVPASAPHGYQAPPPAMAPMAAPSAAAPTVFPAV